MHNDSWIYPGRLCLHRLGEWTIEVKQAYLRSEAGVDQILKDDLDVGAGEPQNASEMRQYWM